MLIPPPPRGADLHKFYSIFHFTADPEPDPAPHQSDETETIGLQIPQVSILSVHASIVCVHAPPTDPV
jgi:hypothetical protein